MSKDCTCGGCKALYQEDWSEEEKEYFFSGLTANRNIEPSFDEIINPTGNWDEEIPKSKPKHERKEKKMQKLLSILAKTFVVAAFFVGILWMAKLAGDLLIAIFPG
jgi:hypothetical protein